MSNSDAIAISTSYTGFLTAMKNYIAQEPDSGNGLLLATSDLVSTLGTTMSANPALGAAFIRANI